jgi:hypothetical protein
MSMFHYYINVNAFECEAPCEGFVPRLDDNPNNSHMKRILVHSITLASRLPLKTSSHVSNLFSIPEAFYKPTH